jgi:hypothetical protein
MKEVEMVVKMKLSPTLGCWTEYIGGDQPSWKEIAVLNRCHLWRSLPDRAHTARMYVHTGRMLYVDVAGDLLEKIELPHDSI